MLKPSMILSLLLITSGFAHANDTGMPAIRVSDITVSTVKGFGDQEVKKPVKKDTRVVAEFHGKDAAKLMQILPSINYVEGSESYRQNNKSLDIVGNNHGSVSITCRGGDTSTDGEKQVVTKTYEAGPRCTVSIETLDNGDGRFEEFEDFNPSASCKE